MSLKKFTIILTLSLAALMGVFLFYVSYNLKNYENNQLDTFMGNFIDNLKDPTYEITIIDADSIKKSAFDSADASIRSGLAYLAQNNALTFKQTPDPETQNSKLKTQNSKLSFDIFCNEEPILRVVINSQEEVNCLGMFKYNIWKVEEVRPLKKDGLFNLDLSLPGSYIVEVNGKKLTEKQSSDSLYIMGYSEISKQVPLTYQVDYSLKGLVGAPDIKITDKDGKPVECEINGTKLSKTLNVEKIADQSVARTKIKNYPDVAAIARQWSLFVSRDLGAGDNAFSAIKPYLIEGTYHYHFAKKYSASVDITYVSNHSFGKEKFTNEKICNFEVYSPREFACDVIMQKNIICHEAIPDRFAERIHFVYYDDTSDGKDNPTWKILSMASIVD